MRPDEFRDRMQREARRQLSSLRILQPEKVTPSGFHYGYLARLIDDRDLSSIADPRLRSVIRSAHRQVYRRSLRLLKRDVERMLVNRRKLMGARREWRFEALISETARIWQLVWTLQIAGIAHGFHVPVLVTAVRQACSDLDRLMAQPAISAPAFHAR